MGPVLPQDKIVQVGQSMKVSPVREFAHAADYQWLQGELEYSHHNRTWQLRYASASEDDPWGGSMILMADPTSIGLKEGHFVKLFGHISNPDDDKRTLPVYKVDRFELMDKPKQ